MRKVRLLIMPLLLIAAAPLGAADAPPEHIRGTITGVDGERIAVATDDGRTLEVTVPPDTGIFQVTPATLDDLKQGDFVGLTSIESGGRRVALEAHLFSEDLRGTGEGHFAWDLVKEPNMMTNATIAEVKEMEGDRELRVEYAPDQGGAAGEQTILVPDQVPVVRLEKAADRSLIEAGRQVFLMVEPGEQGQRKAVAVAVGAEGATPPM